MHHLINRQLLLIAALVAGLSFDGLPQEQKNVKTDFDSYRDTLSNGKIMFAELPKGRSATDYTPRGFVRQPSFVRGAGLLNKNEHAVLLYMDGDLLPPGLMAGYRYGLLYWWNVGLDVGGDAGVFQAIMRTRIENIKLRKTESFIWSNEFSAGFKYHSFDFGNNARFDDRSLVATVDNSFAYRFKPARTKSVYLTTLFYVDYDLHSPRRQTDYYLMPVFVGFESMRGDHRNFFLELGAAYSFNGMQFGDGTILYDKSWFPVFRCGITLRTGSKTAVYYTRETRRLSRGIQPHEVK
jgi:hypothetical protein